MLVKSSKEAVLSLVQCVEILSFWAEHIPLLHPLLYKRMAINNLEADDVK